MSSDPPGSPGHYHGLSSVVRRTKVEGGPGVFPQAREYPTLVFAALAILGMTFLAESLGAFFAVFRYLGAGYLIWLGIALFRSADELRIKETGSSSSSLATSFLAGFFLTLGDIKAILFYASLFPAVVDLASLSAAGMGILLLITVVTVGGIKLVYAFGAGAIVHRLHGRVWSKWINRTAGGLMVGTGGYLIAKT